MTRYVTTEGVTWVNAQTPDPTPVPGESEDPERYRIMRLCPCSDCNTSGHAPEGGRCKTCRGEGRQLQELATCATKEAVGVAIVTLAGEGEFEDDCQFGLIDRLGEKGKKWLVLPFRPSPRNISDAARTLAHARHQQ